MEIERKAASTGSAYIAYPQFPDDGCEKMNGFYLSLVEEAKKAADRLPAGVRYNADYKIEESGGKTSVTYTVRARRYGHTEASGTFTHTWENGLIAEWHECDENIAQPRR